MEATLETEPIAAAWIPPEPQCDHGEIVRALRLFHHSGEPFEIRILHDGNRTSAGYFNDCNIAADAVVAYDRKRSPKGIYHVLNVVNPGLFARSPNRITDGLKPVTSDEEIVLRRVLLVDLDPDRESETSSTDEELQSAVEASEAVREFLRRWGFPECVHAISGNGVHLLTPMEMPNDEPSRQACRSLLNLLKDRQSQFVTDGRPPVKIDISVHNASRICRLYGTPARKGIHSADR
ncbi:MAG: hypothetical protein Q8K78_09075, partial [Planctomycetaceae bacterium]|nr:hypothetical protein [Planctomycetaceae bacterium]